MNQLKNSIKKNITAKGNYLVALSGGIDSCVLLHLLQSLYKDAYISSLRAVHINHGLQKTANKWQEFCADYCKNLGVEFTSLAVNVANAGNLESEARNSRYQAIAKIIKPQEILATAHHANDLMETFLFRMLRGTGLAGIAMAKNRQFTANNILERPLLYSHKKTLLTYANANNLNWVEDPSNSNENFDRNFIRHSIIAPIEKRNISSLTSLVNSIKLLEEQKNMLQFYAEQDLKQYTQNNNQLCVPELTKLQKQRQCCLIATWLTINCMQIASRKHIIAIYEMLKSTRDTAAYVGCLQQKHNLTKKFYIRRFANKLHFVPNYLADTEHKIINLTNTDQEKLIELPQGKLIFKRGGTIILPDVFDLKFRQGGEIISFNQQHKKLKKMWVPWAVPLWQRDEQPLFFTLDKLFCVPNYYVDLNNKNSNNKHWQVIWQPTTYSS